MQISRFHTSPLIVCIRGSHVQRWNSGYLLPNDELVISITELIRRNFEIKLRENISIVNVGYNTIVSLTGAGPLRARPAIENMSTR